MLINLMCLMTLLNFSMYLSLYMWNVGVIVYMDCTLINFMHFLVHQEQPPVHADQFDMPHDPLELLHVLSLYMRYMGVIVYMDCTLINFGHFYVHPEQPPVHADQFHVPHNPLELFHVSVLIHVVHGGHGVLGLHPNQLRALLSASRTTSCSCWLGIKEVGFGLTVIA
jgi:hypothetical protein